MQIRRLATPVGVLVFFLVQACSTAPSKSERDDPASLLRGACKLDGTPHEVTGSVWMKAKSKEASGQFPATVQAKANPSEPLELRLEVTQLLGARAALIEIRGNDFKVETPKQGSVNKKASSWGGIPLDWASQLFLDRFPCPADEELSQLRWHWLSDSELEGRAASGEVIWKYKFRRWNLKPWVEAVFWQKSPEKSLEITRDDPDPSEGWARRWEASSPSGQVKVRWKDRRVH